MWRIGRFIGVWCAGFGLCRVAVGVGSGETLGVKTSWGGRSMCFDFVRCACRIERDLVHTGMFAFGD